MNTSSQDCTQPHINPKLVQDPHFLTGLQARAAGLIPELLPPANHQEAIRKPSGRHQVSYSAARAWSPCLHTETLHSLSAKLVDHTLEQRQLLVEVPICTVWCHQHPIHLRLCLKTSPFSDPLPLTSKWGSLTTLPD